MAGSGGEAQGSFTELCSQTCGARCCRGPAVVELSPAELTRLRRLALHRGLTPWHGRAVDETIKGNASGYGGHMVLSAGEHCLFLDDETNLCTIYEERPERCRQFPLQEKQRGCLLSGWKQPPRIALGVARSGERMNLEFEAALVNTRNFLAHEGSFAGIHERISHVVDANQNDIAGDFLKSDAEYLVFLEDDMVFTPNAASMMVWKMEHATKQGTDLPILCGLYFQRTDVPITHFYHPDRVEYVQGEPIWVDTSMTEEVEALLEPLPIPADNSPYCLGPEHNSILQIDTGSTGFTCVRRDVFENIPYPWFRRMGGEIGEPGGTAPDFGFFYRAAKYGFNTYGDVGIGAGHLALKPVGAGSFRRYRDEAREVVNAAVSS